MNAISREDWGAEPAIPYYRKHTPQMLIIHHSATRVTLYRGATTAQAMQRYHQRHNGWSDIGYHYLIGPDGAVYAGRPIWAVGAHCKGYNLGSTGICVIGDYQTDQLSSEAKAVLIELIIELDKEYHYRDIIGHRERGKTLCPGDNLQAEIDAINKVIR